MQFRRTALLIALGVSALVSFGSIAQSDTRFCWNEENRWALRKP